MTAGAKRLQKKKRSVSKRQPLKMARRGVLLAAEVLRLRKLQLCALQDGLALAQPFHLLRAGLPRHSVYVHCNSELERIFV